MKTFIIYTTTQQEWEIVGGIYVVNAQSTNDAAGLWLERSDRFPHTPGCGPETIERVDEINVYSEDVIILQHPIIE